MRSATGRWVSGADFFDRELELRILEDRVQEGNHVLLTGQRRMGKTSMTRELGRRLTGSGGWVALFADIEDAACPPRPGDRGRCDARARITEILDLLVHDGYLEAAGEDHEFPSRLLKDWWAARFRAHHVPIADRSSDAAERRTR